jgi:hypothetical protein
VLCKVELCGLLTVGDSMDATWALFEAERSEAPQVYTIYYEEWETDTRPRWPLSLCDLWSY